MDRASIASGQQEFSKGVIKLRSEGDENDGEDCADSDDGCSGSGAHLSQQSGSGPCSGSVCQLTLQLNPLLLQNLKYAISTFHLKTIAQNTAAIHEGPILAIKQVAQRCSPTLIHLDISIQDFDCV